MSSAVGQSEKVHSSVRNLITARALALLLLLLIALLLLLFALLLAPQCRRLRLADHFEGASRIATKATDAV